MARHLPYDFTDLNENSRAVQVAGLVLKFDRMIMILTVIIIILIYIGYNNIIIMLFLVLFKRILFCNSVIGIKVQYWERELSR